MKEKPTHTITCPMAGWFMCGWHKIFCQMFGWVLFFVPDGMSTLLPEKEDYSGDVFE